jgi:hypothetical protein
MAAMHLPRPVDEVEQRLGQEGHDLAFLPIVAQSASRGGRFTGRLRRIFFTIDRIRESGKLAHVCPMRLLSGLALR